MSRLSSSTEQNHLHTNAKNQKKSTSNIEQLSLFNFQAYTQKVNQQTELTVEFVDESKRATKNKPCTIKNTTTKTRLKQTFTFSVAIAIREKSKGWDWTPQKNGKPRFRRKPKNHIVSLTANSEAWEVEEC